jgi:hypothetical protein
MRASAFIAVLVAAVAVMGDAPAAQSPDRVLQLSFDADGRVTLRAQNVTPREILAEWARLCACYLVNFEKLPGEAVKVPLLFEQQPQSIVLSSLLRQAAGYVLTPRRANATGPSQYETIYILASSSPATGGYSASSTPYVPNVPIPTAGSPEAEIPPVPELSSPPPANPASQQPARPAGPGIPSTGSVFVPIVAAPSPFSTPAPNRGGGPAAPAPPGQTPAPPGGRVGANP